MNQLIQKNPLSGSPSWGKINWVVATPIPIPIKNNPSELLILI